MNKRVKIISLAALLIIAFFAGDTLASDVEMWFSLCPADVGRPEEPESGERTTIVSPGRYLWVVVFDPGRNLDPTKRDIIPATEIMVGSPNTRLWLNPLWLAEDKPVRRLIETGINTNIFVLSHPIRIGARHAPGTTPGAGAPFPQTHIPAEDATMWIPAEEAVGILPGPIITAMNTKLRFRLGDAQRDVAHLSGAANRGRFVDGDTLIGIYRSYLHPAVGASAMVQIRRTPATIGWDRDYYLDTAGRGVITITDPDENLHPGIREYVPVFIIVNPGTWNPVEIVGGLQQTPARTLTPVRMRSATSFQMLLESGGVVLQPAPALPNTWQCRGAPIRWYNIYDPGRRIVYVTRVEDQPPGLVNNAGRPAHFKTLNQPNMPGLTTVVFFAKETLPGSGKFVLELLDIQTRLGFRGLGPEYVLAAFYIDPNDPSDIAIDIAYAISRPAVIPIVSFVDALPPSLLRLGRDRINVKVGYDPFTVYGAVREEVVVQIFSPQSTDREWITLKETTLDSPDLSSIMGLGLEPVIWVPGTPGTFAPPWGPPPDLGNKNLETFGRSAIIVRFNAVDVACYPKVPEIITGWRDHASVAFAVMEVARTPVFDGKTAKMWFVDADGNKVTAYTIGQAVFIKVNDPDQDQELWAESITNGVVVFNLHTNRKKQVDLRETAAQSGIFRSVEPIHLTEHLGARTGDTIHAFFQDPSDPSDAAIITTRIVAFVNHPPVAVADSYSVLMDGVLTVPAPGVLGNDTDPDRDPPRAAELVTGVPLPHRLEFRTDGSFTFIPGPGFFGTVTFTYRALDRYLARSGIATVTITVREVVVVPPPLRVDDFRVVHGLRPEFSFIGAGIADTFTVTIFNMLGREVRRIVARDVAPGVIVRWDGLCAEGNLLAKGPYIFVAKLKDGAILFTIRGTVFRK